MCDATAKMKLQKTNSSALWQTSWRAGTDATTVEAAAAALTRGAVVGISVRCLPFFLASTR